MVVVVDSVSVIPPEADKERRERVWIVLSMTTSFASCRKLSGETADVVAVDKA